MSQQFPGQRRATAIPLAAAVVLALVTVLTGCQGLKGEQKTLPAAHLKKELLTAPAGSRPYSRGTFAPGGILNLNQYVDGNFAVKDRVDEKTAAAQDGFDYAVQTNWHAPDGTQADIFLIQFSGSAGAQDFVTDVSEGTAQNEAPTEPLSSLPGIATGEAWHAGSVDDVGYIRQYAWFAVGNIVADLHYYTPGASKPTALDQLAKAQYARLVGHVTSPSPLPLSAATPPPASAAGSAPATPADKKRLLGDLVTPPRGSHPWRHSTGNGATGILTLQQLLVRFATTAADRQQVTAEEEDRGFQYAVRENWHNSDGSQADIVLLQFSTATGAQSFALSYQSSAADTVGSSGTYEIPGSGDAKAYQHSHLNSTGDIWTETYAVIGNVALDIDFWVPAKADRAALTRLVRKQYNKLLADPTLAAAAAAAPALPSSDS